MDQTPPVPWATPIGVVLLLSAIGLAIGDPRTPRWHGPVQIHLTDADGAPVVGDVAARCWHAHLDPAFTEASGPTDAAGTFSMDTPDCLALEFAAVSPGWTPVLDRTGRPDGGPVSVALTPLPQGPEPDIREAGWRGRSTDGARLEATQSPDGTITVVGWDILGDRPATRQEDADLWLKPGKSGGIDRMTVGAAGDVGDSTEGAHAVALRVAENTPFPWDSLTWLPAEDAEGRRLTGLITQDGHTQARVKFADAPECPAPCLTRTWTLSVLIFPPDQGPWTLPAPRRAIDLLSAPAPSGPRASPTLAQLLGDR